MRHSQDRSGGLTRVVLGVAVLCLASRAVPQFLEKMVNPFPVPTLNPNARPGTLRLPQTRPPLRMEDQILRRKIAEGAVALRLPSLNQLGAGAFQSIVWTDEKGVPRVRAIEAKLGSRKLKIAKYQGEWLIQSYDESGPRTVILPKARWAVQTESQARTRATAVAAPMMRRLGLRVGKNVQQVNLGPIKGMREWPSYSFTFETWGRLGKAMMGPSIDVTLSAETGQVLRYQLNNPGFRVIEPKRILPDSALASRLQKFLAGQPNASAAWPYRKFKRTSYGYSTCLGPPSPNQCAIAVMVPDEANNTASVVEFFVSVETGKFVGVLAHTRPDLNQWRKSLREKSGRA